MTSRRRFLGLIAGAVPALIALACGRSQPASPSTPTTPPSLPTPTPGPLVLPTPLAGVPTPTPLRAEFHFGSLVRPDDRALIRSGIEVTARYLEQAAQLQPAECLVFAFTSGQSLEEALADVPEAANLTIDAITQRLQFLPAETHPGLIFVNPSTQAWQSRPSVQRLRVAGHEYFHIVQMELLGRRMTDLIFSTPVHQTRPEGPSWLFEGSADYVSWKAIESAGLTALDNHLTSASVVNDTDITELETFIEYYASPENRAILSLLAVDLLVGDDGARRLVDYYDAVGSGMRWPEAFWRIYGRTVDAFYAEFRAFMATR
jgi:hypothetical protein